MREDVLCNLTFARSEKRLNLSCRVYDLTTTTSAAVLLFPITSHASFSGIYTDKLYNFSLNLETYDAHDRSDLPSPGIEKLARSIQSISNLKIS